MILMLHKIRDWFLALFQRKEPIYQLVNLDDTPEETLSPRHIYYIGMEDNKWCILFLCPCGCEETIYLNTLLNDKPRWTIRQESKQIFSIHPSIHRRVGCRSHFFIRESKVVFV